MSKKKKLEKTIHEFVQSEFSEEKMFYVLFDNLVEGYSDYKYEYSFTKHGFLIIIKKEDNSLYKIIRSWDEINFTKPIK